MIKSGTIYRKHWLFNLKRIWDISKPIATVILANPTTEMDGKSDNQTIKKLINLCKYNGIGGFDLVFVVPLRLNEEEKYDRKYDRYSLAMQIRNIDNIQYYLDKNETTICAWGLDDNINMLAVPILYSAIKKEKYLQCFGISLLTSYPRNPTKLPLTTPLIPYTTI